MSAGPTPESPRPVWERASLPSGVAISRSSRVAALAVVVGALISFAGGWTWALSVALGGAVVLLVLWASARVLIAGARRSSPVAALGLAVLLYLVAIVGLFVLAVQVRPGPDGHGTVHAAGVAGGALGVVVVWSAALLLVHVRHDSGPGGRARRR